ncbi:glycosyltransferase [Roseomonas sp. E05]|uniref:glycosyltransferase n=1 Tax=Roseomonas sp. E05 TaxID=3046310 RepID=UPI0024B8C0DE|nr:glycosyltransferase [Roseomonas sp. E05]MDJ0390567.1 glycosyltransferase [Roseomonas sp. E05]
MTSSPRFSEELAFPEPSEQLPFTGERYTSDISGPIRHQHHHRYLFAARFCAGRDVLDVACGEGYGSALLGTVARSVRGVDLDPGTVAFAERNYGADHVSFRQGDAARLVEQNAFDVVVSFETIEHLVDHDGFLQGIRRALRPGGLLIISSPDRTIYTEADGHENEFHLRELDRAEFKDLIGGRFAQVTILEQDSLVGSLIGPEGGAPAPLELLASTDGRTYRQALGNPKAHYLIALASDAPLPPVSASALDDGSWLAQTEKHAVALGREVMVRDTEIERLNGELQSGAQDRARIAGELAQARAAIADLQRETQQMQALISERARLQGELAQARAAIADLQRETQQMQALISERARLQGELAQARTAIADLQRETQQMQALIDERARQIEEIRASTSWRLTKPVRKVGSATAGLRRRLRAALIPAAAPPVRRSNERPRVLFIDWMVPTPDQDSGSLDLWNQLCLFQAMGYDTAFMPVMERPSDAPYADALRKAGVQYLVGEAGTSPEQLLQETANDFDLILLNRIHVAGRLLAHVRRCAPNARVVFNTVDLHFLREEREAALEGSLEKAQTALQRRHDELRCMAEADATIVLSDEEGRLLSELLPGSAVHVIPFARGLSSDGPGFEERRGVLFVGGFLHAPNIDAAEWLVGAIWPKVRRVLPGARLEIVGSNAPPKVRQLDDPGAGVAMRGFVQDLHPLLSRARLTVAPLRFGAGIKGKVAMSLAAGVPCVATPIASEGMGLADGQNILLGRDADEIAAAIVRAHEDAALWARLSSGGRAVMRDRYSLERVGGLFIALVRSLGIAVPARAEEKIAGLRPREWSL